MMADSHEITVRNYKQPMRNRLVMMLICIGIALASFFVVSKWATSVESYRWVIKTLNGLQKKALGLSRNSNRSCNRCCSNTGRSRNSDRE